MSAVKSARAVTNSKMIQQQKSTPNKVEHNSRLKSVNNTEVEEREPISGRMNNK